MWWQELVPSTRRLAGWEFSPASLNAFLPWQHFFPKFPISFAEQNNIRP